METRLEILEPAFAEKIKQIHPSKRRESAYKIAGYAIDHAGIQNDLVTKILHELSNGNLLKASALKGQLEALLDELEETQLTLRKQANLGQVAGQKSQKAYNQARAVNALLFALDPDSYIAFTEAAYEAYSITQDLTALNSILFS
jgi:L-rhamnose isomerase